MGLLTESGGASDDKNNGSQGTPGGDPTAGGNPPENGGAGGNMPPGEGTPANEPGTPTGGTQNTPSAAPDFSAFVEGLPEDLKNDPSMKVPTSYEELAKMFVNGQKAIGADKIVVPGKHADDKAWSEIYKKLGMPESEDKYEFKTPEGMKADDEFLKSFKEHAFKNNIMPKQAESLLEFYHTNTQTIQEKLTAQAQKSVDEGIENLKKEWGPDFDNKIRAGKVAMEHFNDKDKSFTKYVDEVGLDDDPEFLKFMARVGESLNEDTFDSVNIENVHVDAANAKSQIEKIMGDKSHPYNDKTHPGHKRAVEEMFKLHQKAEQAEAKKTA